MSFENAYAMLCLCVCVYVCVCVCDYNRVRVHVRLRVRAAGPRPRKLLRAGPKEPAADASDAGVGIVEPARAENRRRRRKSAPNSTSGSMIQAETLCCSADAVAELPSNLRRLAKSGVALLDVVG